jgi:hypothetical protein
MIKLTLEEKDKIKREYQDWAVKKAKEIIPTDIIVETPDFWLSKIDTILEERVKETIGKHNARILNHFQLFGEDERVALIPAITKATEETLPSLNKCTHESDGLSYTSNPPQSRCVKCKEFYR